MSEYEANPIASDSEDEKRIQRAEARANRKVKNDRTKKQRRFQPYRKQESLPTMAPRPAQVGRQRPGLCFLCGQSGHWKNECAQARTQSNNKISSNSLLMYDNIRLETESNPMNSRVFESCSSASESNIEPRYGTCKSDATLVSPVGRLKDHVQTWSDVSENQYILHVIANGYKLPFKQIPERARLCNNKSARGNPVFVQKEIESLLKKGVISEAQHTPHVINPLTVAYNKVGKARLVLDCRHINPSLHLFKVKFEDINIATKMFDLSSYTFTFDLKSAYHHIDIFKEHTVYLGFSWDENGIAKYYVYNSLPFGLATYLPRLLEFW